MNMTISNQRSGSRLHRSIVTALVALFCMAASPALAQHVVKGTVTDASGAALPGVTIQVKGQKNAATITDANGNYTISAPRNAQLVFTYIGMQQQTVSVGSKRNLDVSLNDDSSTLNDVVVVGYGQVKKQSLTGSVAPGTRIGVRKWFPGPEVRDTIRIATCGGSNLTVLSQAVQNNNFLSDDDQQVFYSAKINNNAIFLIRCATFRHQMQGVNLPLAGYQGKDVLQYGILASNSCPSGGDSIVYNIQGGFAPYTYTWTLKGTGGADDKVIREYTSPFANTQVQNGLNHGVEDYFWASISDTLLTPPVDMQNETFGQADVHVVAVDATGVCSLSKDLTIRLHRVAEITDIKIDNLAAMKRELEKSAGDVRLDGDLEASYARHPETLYI